MVSVTSDVTASGSFPSAPPKPALPDPSQLAGNFAALVDNNLPADPSTMLPPAPEPSAPLRASQTQNTSSPSDNNPNPPSNPQGTANQNPPPGGNASDNSAATNQTQPATTGADQNYNKNNSNNAQKSTTTARDGTSKTGSGKSTDKSSANSDGSNSGTTAQPAGQAVITPNPIAALLPVASAITGTPTASSNSNAPLGIAAAAIAATSSTTASLTGSATQTKTDSAATGTTTAATTTPAGTIPAGKTPVPGAAIAATATQLTSADADVSADVALLTAVGAPGTTKASTTGLKTAAATTQAKAATDAAPGTQAAPDPSAKPATTDATQNGAAPQPAADAKPNTTATPADAVKPDGNSAAAPSTTATADHSSAAGNGAPAPAVDASAQVIAVPQQLSAATPVVTTDKLTVTQATGAAVPVSGLAVTIAATAQSGKTSFDVRLDPADLGRIDVRINVDSNGQVTSHLTVEKPETLSMLQQDAPQLQQALNDAGLKTGSGGLQFSLRDQSSSGQNNTGSQSGGQPQRLVVIEENPVPAVIAGRSYGRTLGASGGVDIRV